MMLTPENETPSGPKPDGGGNQTGVTKLQFGAPTVASAATESKAAIESKPGSKPGKPGGSFLIRTGELVISPLVVRGKACSRPIPNFSLRAWTVQIYHATQMGGIDLGNGIWSIDGSCCASVFGVS